MAMVSMSELELLVATAIEAADPGMPGGLDELGGNPMDWLPEARAAILTVVQMLRDRGACGGGRYAAGWMEAADWMESQLLDDEFRDHGIADNEDEDNDE